MLVSWTGICQKVNLEGLSVYARVSHVSFVKHTRWAPNYPAMNVVICNPYKWGYNPTSKGVMIPPITGSGAHHESIHPEKKRKNCAASAKIIEVALGWLSHSAIWAGQVGRKPFSLSPTSHKLNKNRASRRFCQDFHRICLFFVE